MGLTEKKLEAKKNLLFSGSSDYNTEASQNMIVPVRLVD